MKKRVKLEAFQIKKKIKKTIIKKKKKIYSEIDLGKKILIERIKVMKQMQITLIKKYIFIEDLANGTVKGRIPKEILKRQLMTIMPQKDTDIIHSKIRKQLKKKMQEDGE